MMNYYYKIKLKKMRVPSLLSKGLLISLIGITALYADDQSEKVSQCFISNQIAIQQYEESGDYAAALSIARNSYGESLKLGLLEDAKIFYKMKERLEKELTTLGFSRLLFDGNYHPRIKLLELLKILGMENLNKFEKEIIQINHWAQTNLLRQGERWQEQTTRFEELKPKLKPLLIELRFVDSMPPHFQEYQGAIVHGALLSRVRLRLHYLIEQWKQGIRFSTLYFLSGERPLEPQEKNKESFIQDDDSPLKIRKGWHFSEVPKTECEMIQLVWNQSEIPSDMREEVEVHFINAPMKEDIKSGKLMRPTTEDTVKAWLKTEPIPGRYLAVTNAPYINRQDIVMRAIAPDEYGFDTVGSSASEQEKMAIFLDELARYIFQMNQLYTLTNSK